MRDNPAAAEGLQMSPGHDLTGHHSKSLIGTRFGERFQILILTKSTKLFIKIFLKLNYFNQFTNMAGDPHSHKPSITITDLSQNLIAISSTVLDEYFPRFQKLRLRIFHKIYILISIIVYIFRKRKKTPVFWRRIKSYKLIKNSFSDKEHIS